MMMEINKLPAEMLLEVHQRLTKSALKKAVLVSRLWRDVGEDPALWEWCRVAVCTKEDINNLSVKRMKRIQEVFINPDTWDQGDWEAFFRATVELRNLKRIDGLYRGPRWGPSGLDLVDPDLLATALAKLEDVDIYGCTFNQIEVLFKEMSSSTLVKNFHLRYHDLSPMDPGLFGGVLSRLDSLRLHIGKVTRDQMEEFFKQVLNNGSLKKLDLLDDNVWIYLEPGLFAKVLSSLEDVSLTDRIVTAASIAHLEALFSELSNETQLKRLSLKGIKFLEYMIDPDMLYVDPDMLYEIDPGFVREIDPGLLANALSRMEELCLDNNYLSIHQLRALFTQISLRTEMKKLVLMRNALWHLNSEDSELFARAIASVENVEIGGSDDNNYENNIAPALFAELSRSNRLKSLKISYGDVSNVDPEVFAKAVARLKTITFYGTSVRNDQMVSLFSEMSRNTAMKKIDVSLKSFSANVLKSVEPEIFVRALMRLEEVRLYKTRITHEQVKAFFTELSQNSHLSQLKKLNLGGDDFTGVDPEVLAMAVTNVEEVCLRHSVLSTEQITSIFEHVLDGEKKLRKLNIGSYVLGRYGRVNPEMVRNVKEKLKLI